MDFEIPIRDGIASFADSCDNQADCDRPAELATTGGEGTSETHPHPSIGMGEESGERSRSIAPQVVRKVSTKDLLRLVNEQREQCALCGSRLTPAESELDHKQPRSQGGTDELPNLQWLCKPCNRSKGELSNTQFIDLCERIFIHTSPLVNIST